MKNIFSCMLQYLNRFWKYIFWEQKKNEVKIKSKVNLQDWNTSKKFLIFMQTNVEQKVEMFQIYVWGVPKIYIWTRRINFIIFYVITMTP